MQKNLYKSKNFILFQNKIKILLNKLLIIIFFLLILGNYIFAQEVDSTNNEQFLQNIENFNFLNEIYLNDTTLDETILSDSILNDTIRKDTLEIKIPPRAKSEFEYPVHYSCDLKGKLDFVVQKAYLYNNANVSYDQINLISDYMEMDFEKKEVLSHGIYDSTNNTIRGKPIFKEGEDEYHADTMRYNFKTKKGIVKNVSTKLDEGFLYGGTTKIQENKHIHIVDGKFTTCDNPDCPHFYFRLIKAKVIPKDKIISGPTYLVIADVPTPLGLPFGIFPNNNEGHSGILIPTFGNEAARGFYLNRGGYYFAINDRLDLTIVGDIYSKGSWAVSANSNYKVRYKFDGFLSAKYSKNITGYKNIPGYTNRQEYEFVWRFNQDAHFRPNTNFSADVNMRSSKFNAYNAYQANDVLEGQQTSSISYSRNFPNTPFNLSFALRHNQTNKTGTIDFTLPDVSFSMNRIFPFKRKIQKGGENWYEKIGISYTMNLTNRIRTNENSFFTIPLDSITNGISHRIPISTSIKFLKYTTLTPNFTYNERWYIKTMQKNWISDPNDTIKLGYVEQLYRTGFNRAWDFNAGISWTTQIYGMFQFLGNTALKAMRHVFTPTLSFNYVPDLSKPKYKMYNDYYQIQYNLTTQQYDTISYVYAKFEGLPYGGPPRSGSGLLSIDLGNNLELKVKNKDKKDTVNIDKKIKLLESFSINTSYNAFIDSLRWSPINISGRTKIAVFDINARATLDPYGFVKNDYGQLVRINKWSYFINTSNHKIARLTSFYLTIGASLNPNAKTKDNNAASHYKEMYGKPTNYVDWDIPWDIRINYSFNYNKPYDTKNITQSLELSGSISITKKWRATVNTGYDFVRKEVTYTTIDITRDLHCWEATLNLRPFGTFRSYMFRINVKSSMLQDLKLKKERSWQDNER